MSHQDRLAQRLARVQAKIDSHPFSSPPVTRAFEVIERLGKENSPQISKELSEQNLPSLDQLGKLQIRHMFSWWNVNRQKRAILRRMRG